MWIKDINFDFCLIFVNLFNEKCGALHLVSEPWFAKTLICCFSLGKPRVRAIGINYVFCVLKSVVQENEWSRKSIKHCHDSITGKE